jgi:hypothetical protein
MKNYETQNGENIKKNICIVHYNTPYLTECLVKSINKYTPDCHIYIFDNSDKEPFTYKQDNLTIYDNTQEQIINFNKILNEHPKRYKGTLNNYGSFKHCISIQKCIELINDNFILMDSDVLLKKDISVFYQEDKIFVGDIERLTQKKCCGNMISERVCPYICFINVNMCKELNITYYNENFMYGLCENDTCAYWDTGVYFYKEARKYDYLLLDIQEYIEHLRSASWGTEKKVNEWLSKNSKLWDDKKIIVSLTSWVKRINNIPTVLTTIINQTLLPYKIVLNLSTEEFVNKEKDIPENVINFINTYPLIEINWVNGKNTKQWKKFIPTMKKYPNDWIICIDDDRIYWQTFIEDLWNTHLKFPNNPITINSTYKVNNYLQHCGHGTLETAKFYNYFNDVDIEYLIDNFVSSDTVYNFLLNKNGYNLLKCDKSDKSKLYNEIESLRTTNGTYNVKIHKETFKILEYKYGKIGEKFISKPVEQNQPILEKKIQNDNNVTLKRTLNKQKRRIKYI